MNQEIKQRWVDALRSGEYKQGQRKLKWGDRFCCLGVLCNLHAKETGNEWRGYFFEGINYFDYFGEGEVLPYEIMDWAGLEENDPFIRTGEKYEYRISNYNDEEQYDFNQLADLIEKHL